MKIVALFTLFSIWFSIGGSPQPQNDVSIGDTYVIQSPASSEYQNIHFPRKNFIIKRGGIANMKSVYGTKVEVTSITYDKDGMTIVTLEPVSGRKFFHVYPSVTANLEKALETGELK